MKEIIKNRPPRILLVGAGRFGKQHLRVWRSLEQKNRVILAGVVVKTKRAQAAIAKEFIIPVFSRLNARLLKEVDGVDIVTPSTSHFLLTKKSLRYTNVFVEKPLADTVRRAIELRSYAKKQNKFLMVGHIYRFHPVFKKLKKFLKEGSRPQSIRGRFVSPVSSYRNEDPFLEKLHFFDILDALFHERPDKVWSSVNNSLASVSLCYKSGMDAHLKLGWRGEEKSRYLEFIFPDKKIRADFGDHTITITGNKKNKVISCPANKEPLEEELSTFVDVLRGKEISYPDADLGVRIVDVAERARLAVSKNPRIAVIGGGVFGLTAAITLGKHFDVEVFERHADILEEASRANQYRHHSGYHYPRSPETIQEIREAGADFEKLYGSIVVSKFPSYYCVAKTGSLVTAGQFLKICGQTRLPYRRAYPPAGFLNSKTVDLCIKTPEAIYDYEALKRLLKKKIKDNPRITLNLGHEVTGGRIDPLGKKILTIDGGRQKIEKKFDHVINATYAHHNDFCTWFGFPSRPLELRLKELVVVRLSVAEKCAVTIMDGPFTTLVPMAEKNLFTFGDVPLSVHESNLRRGTPGSYEKKFKRLRSRWEAMRERCQYWLPIIKDAEYVRSLFVVLPVEPAASATDARPTTVTEHGFGCWSILSGKIITCVSTAKKIADEL
jgi:predicted dehydrogenase